MLIAFEQFITENNLCTKGEKILVAVSGGIDSVVLLDLFIQAKYSIGIAHCNFNLRDDESDQDEVFVKNLATKYKVEFHPKTCNAMAYTKQHQCSIQEAARELRYDWFEEVCQLNGYDKIAVAQHADDQIETFFINLLRGSGVAGLKGMPLKRENVIRPLLFAERKEIEQYAKERNLDFREDSSNLSDKYLRNQIRHHLLPQLEKIKVDYRKPINKSLQYLTEDHQMIQHFIEGKRNELFIDQVEVVKIPLDKLFDSLDQHSLLFYLLKDFGFNRDVTDAICEAVQNNNTGKLFYSSDYQLLIDREFLLLKKAGPKFEDDTFYIRSVGDNINMPISLKLEIAENNSLLQISKDPSIAYFDLEKLNFPLIVRKWKVGDRFIPFGMEGSKLVSDFLIDQKVNRFEKDRVYVLESERKIIWLIGYRISDEFRITEKTETVLVVKLTN